MFISKKMKPLLIIALLFVNCHLMAEITFTPDKPVVEMDGKIELSVSGTVGDLTWSAQKGWIEGTGTTVKYSAPSQPGADVITVMDEEENIAMLKIQIPKLETKDPSSENVVWEVFTNRDDVQALALSKDKTTLWVGTAGGLEKRNTLTGEVEKVYINTDGLPNNYVRALLSDAQGGVWIGTYNGLAHFKSDGSWQIFNTDNSNLPSNDVNALLSDNQGGVWVGTDDGGLVHFKSDGTWQIFNTDNSNLPYKDVNALLSDNQGGVWVGTDGAGLAHFKSDGSWQVFNTDNSNLPNNWVKTILSDKQGGVWVGTFKGGLANIKSDGSWQIFNENNSNLPDNNVIALLSDNQGGVWVGTAYGGLVHFKSDGTWQIFNTDNSNLPYKDVNALLSDNQGGVWVGTDGAGLAHFKADGTWQVFNTDTKLPNNWVQSLLSDKQGGVWVGTIGGGLANLKSDGSWQVFNTDNSNLPHNNVRFLLSDDKGGVYVGTFGGGLANLKSDGTWQVFNKYNSNLPDNFVQALLSDKQGGVWVGTYAGGLAHFKSNGSWQVFNTDNSDLPYNRVYALLSDNQGGVWVGTYDGGLANLKSDGTWQVFNEDNSNLPDNYVKALLSDKQGGVWVGTGGGLGRLKSDGTWQIFNTDTKLPNNWVQSLLSDKQGGVWVGTGGGLGHLKADGSWQIFNIDNSNLPDNRVSVLLSDEQGGVLVGTAGGLVRLSFDKQQSGKRAAIIIAGGGNQASNSLWDTTESISTYFYKMLNKRKFVNSEIYYLSSQPWADFNGDGFDDKIVDAPRPVRPISLDDVKKALSWAKDQGKLDQPLYLFFIDHGGEGKVKLAKNTNMSAEEFKVILDDYQNATGNKVVILLEACYSGSFLPILAAPNRAIITSAKSNELAYFEDEKGFSRFFTRSMLKGMNFLEAFDYSVNQQKKMLNNIEKRFSSAAEDYIKTSQTPQCDDNGDGVYDKTSDGQWLKQLRINGNIKTLDFTLDIESLTTSSPLGVGETVQLRAKASTASGQVERVWAVIRPPRMNLVLDSNGTPILAYPSEELSKTEETDVFEGSWNQAVYNGDYQISFYAKDDDDNIEMSEESVVISVSGGIEPPPSAGVDILIDKDKYAKGEHFKFELIEQLGWGYDLYAAIILPNGKFFTLKGTNEFSKIDKPEKWSKPLKYNEKMTAIDLNLPSELPTGNYCLYGILSPQRENPLAVVDKWVSSQKCFELF